MTVGHRFRFGFKVLRAIALCFVLGCGLLLVALVLFRFVSGRVPVRQLNYSELIQEIDKGNVSKASIDTSKDSLDVTGILRHPENSFSVPLEQMQIEDLRKHLSQAGTQTSIAEKVEPGSIKAYGLIGEIVLFLIAFFLVVGWQLNRALKDLRMLRAQENK
jgi:ATP-dependent Zn protease